MNTFCKQYRLKTKSEFGEVLQKGKKYVCSQFVVLALPSVKSHSRLGIIVSKKVGQATVRNKIKRKLREIFRQLSPQDMIKHSDVVFIARRTASFTTYQELNSAVVHSFHWLEKKLA